MNLKCLRRCWLPSAGVFCLMLCAAGAARGEDAFGGLFRRLFGIGDNAARQERRAEPTLDLILDIEAPADFANQYTPLLTKLMTAELHFANKVCELDAAQLQKLTDVGRLTVAKISKMFESQTFRGSPKFPDARQLITEAFRQEIEALIPPEAAARYRDEIAEREEARREAAREMMTMLIDRKLSLTPEQYAQIDEALAENWDANWSKNMQVYLYDEYAPMPHADVLQPLLTDRQRTIWASRGSRGQISFGWEQDLGLMAPWGDVGDLEVEIASPPDEQLLEEEPQEAIRDEGEE